LHIKNGIKKEAKMAKSSTLPNEDEQYELPVEEALELARAHHLSGNFILAERTYHDVLRAVPDDPTTNHLLGAMYYQLGNIEQAIHYMKISTELEPNERQYWSNYGSVLSIDKQFALAIECYDKALEIEPENIETLNRKALTHWQNEEHKKAQEISEKVLSLSPDNLEGYINLGISLANQDKLEEAAKLWEEASQKHPSDTRVWSNWSNTLRELKKPVQSKKVALKALELDEHNTDALNNLGCTLRDLGQSEEAVKYFRKATDFKPNYYLAHYNLSLALYDLGRFEEAVVAARYTIDFNDTYSKGYSALSAALIECGEFGQAHYAAQKALQLAPDDAESYLNLADVLYLSSQFDDGHAALKEALKREPEDARVYAKLANIYERLDEVENALEAIDKAIELEPEMPIFLARKAAILQVSNDVDEALVLVDKALDIAPTLMPAFITKAESLIAVNRLKEAEETLRQVQNINKKYPPLYLTLSNVKRFESEDDEDFKIMLSLEEETEKMGLSYTASLFFAIAKGYENVKKYDLAFDYYKKANEARKTLTPYDPEKIPDNYDKFKQDFSINFLTELNEKGFESDEPIFIVGMPRSGTTLTEQIISSHPDVYGTGELPDITRARRKIGALTADNAKEMGELYVELAKKRIKGGPFKKFTDKMPANYLNIGLLNCILPNAKIIHCRRNPLDTCLSNYKQNYMMGQFWSYDLEELGKEYLRYLDLMEYWHEVLPDKVLDINYEDTVNDLENQARKLIDFIGLEWNDACLEPHKQKRAILTASKTQVTKPVYKSSVQKWKRYEKQLSPLVQILKDKVEII
jgi:tetratricopeptide (TPR) repeat protein